MTGDFHFYYWQKKYINNDEDLLIANSDQYVLRDGLFESNTYNVDGVIWTFKSKIPTTRMLKNSDGLVTEVAEKKVISDITACGIYWYNKGSEFVRYVEKMISDNIRHNNGSLHCTSV